MEWQLAVPVVLWSLSATAGFALLGWLVRSHFFWVNSTHRRLTELEMRAGIYRSGGNKASSADCGGRGRS